MGQFDTAIATATRMIAKFGQSVTWRKMTISTLPDANKPWLPTTDTKTEYTVSIVFLPTNRANEELIRYLKGSDVTLGSVYGLMAVQTFEPRAKDTGMRGNNLLRIKNVDPVSPNGQVILYTIEFDQ